MGWHTTFVVVKILLTVTVLLVPELPVWGPRPGVKVALAITVPVLVGVNVTLQVAAEELSVATKHGEPRNDPVAVPLLENATVPRGLTASEAISLTVAVQVVA